MTKTLILLFHPDPARSRLNAVLATAARSVAGVDLVDMAARYPDGRIDMATDGAREAAALLAADRIVWQFPVHWYAPPPLMKTWMDVVLTRMAYRHPETEGAALRGTPLLVAATAGNVPDAYRPGGTNLFTMSELFAPLRAAAHRCGLAWRPPFVVFGATRIGDLECEAAAAAYVSRLRAEDAVVVGPIGAEG